MNFSSPMGIDWYWWLALYASPGLIYVVYQLLKEYRNRPSEFVKGMLAAIGQAKKRVSRIIFLNHLHTQLPL